MLNNRDQVLNFIVLHGLQNPPIRPLQEHVAIFGKLLKEGMSKGLNSKLFKKACLNKCLRELFAVGGGEGCFGYGRLPFFWGMPVNRHSQLYDIVYKLNTKATMRIVAFV